MFIIQEHICLNDPDLQLHDTLRTYNIESNEGDYPRFHYPTSSNSHMGRIIVQLRRKKMWQDLQNLKIGFENINDRTQGELYDLYDVDGPLKSDDPVEYIKQCLEVWNDGTYFEESIECFASYQSSEAIGFTVLSRDKEVGKWTIAELRNTGKKMIRRMGKEEWKNLKEKAKTREDKKKVLRMMI
jgi:hypothetical protein